MLGALILLSLAAAPETTAPDVCRYEPEGATVDGASMTRLLKSPGPARAPAQNLALRSRSDRSARTGRSVRLIHAPFNLGAQAIDFGHVTVTTTAPSGFTVAGVEVPLFWDCAVIGPRVTCASTSSGRPGPLPEIAIRLVATKAGKQRLCGGIGWVGAKDTDPRDNRSCVSVTVRGGSHGRPLIRLAKVGRDPPQQAGR